MAPQGIVAVEAFLAVGIRALEPWREVRVHVPVAVLLGKERGPGIRRVATAFDETFELEHAFFFLILRGGR